MSLSISAVGLSSVCADIARFLFDVTNNPSLQSVAAVAAQHRKYTRSLTFFLEYSARSQLYLVDDEYCVHTVTRILHDAVMRPEAHKDKTAWITTYKGHVEIPEHDLNEGSEKLHLKLRGAAKAKNKRRIAGGNV